MHRSFQNLTVNTNTDGHVPHERDEDLGQDHDHDQDQDQDQEQDTENTNNHDEHNNHIRPNGLHIPQSQSFSASNLLGLSPSSSGLNLGLSMSMSGSIPFNPSMSMSMSLQASPSHGGSNLLPLPQVSRDYRAISAPPLDAYSLSNQMDTRHAAYHQPHTLARSPTHNPTSTSTSTSTPHNHNLPHTPNRTRNTRSTSRVMYDHSRITDWHKVQSLALSHPHHASYRCDHGLTTLHHLCTRRCPLPSVFSALIAAYPRAIIERDDGKGWTPLHHACRFKCPTECVRLLLVSYPEFGRTASQIRDKEKGRTPLYYAMRYDAPEGVAELLLGFMDRNDILNGDRDGVSVLTLIWDKWAVGYEGKRVLKKYEKILDQWKDMLHKCRENSESDDEQEEQRALVWNKILDQSRMLREGLTDKLKGKWDKVNVILRGAFRFELKEKQNENNNINSNGNSISNASKGEESPSQTNGRKFRILHAVAAIKCHSSLFMMACVLHPDQALELDRGDLFGGDRKRNRNGKVSALSMSVNQNGSISSSSDNDKTTEELTALHIAAKAPTSGPDSKAILQQLLIFNPTAAKTSNPSDRSLPLHYLCGNESKQHWIHDGIRTVFEAYTDAATMQDLDGRTPLHRAAALNESLIVLPPPPPLSPAPSDGNTNVNLNGTGNGSHHTTNPQRRSVSDPIGSIIQNLLSIHPEIASIPDKSGKLLLHSIAQHGEHWDSNVQAVYDSNPRALSHREVFNDSMPLHLVAANLDATPELIAKIVEYHPRAASIVDGKGRLPIHLACERGLSWDGGLEEIYNSFRNGIRERVVRAIGNGNSNGNRNGRSDDNNSRNGWMPLHCVASSPYSSLETIKKVIELAPDVAVEMDDCGRTPFHLAVESGKYWEEGGLDILFRANPTAIDSVDWEDKVPLVAALFSYASSSSSSDGGEDVLRETHQSQLNVVYQLLRLAPHVIDDL